MPDPESDWLALGKASEFLGVHPTTLRAWVNAGVIHAFLTPGGHRRFQVAELRAFLDRRDPGIAKHSFISTADGALQHVRQELSQQPVAREYWYRPMSDGERARHRQMGARLLGLLLQFVTRRKNAERFLVEGRRLVKAYGREYAHARFSVVELAQAFLFFRRVIVNAAYRPAGGQASTDTEGMRLLEGITVFMDEMLVATLDAYAQTLVRVRAPHKRMAPSKQMRAKSRASE